MHKNLALVLMAALFALGTRPALAQTPAAAPQPGDVQYIAFDNCTVTGPTVRPEPTYCTGAETPWVPGVPQTADGGYWGTTMSCYHYREVSPPSGDLWMCLVSGSVWPTVLPPQSATPQPGSSQSQIDQILAGQPMSAPALVYIVFGACSFDADPPMVDCVNPLTPVPPGVMRVPASQGPGGDAGGDILAVSCEEAVGVFVCQVQPLF